MLDEIKSLVGKYADITPLPTCLRNHAMLQEIKAGKGPIYMHTQKALDTKEKEEIGWEDFLDMTIGQAVVWASQNIDPKETAVRADHLGALRHGFARHVFRRLGKRAGRLRASGLPVGIQPDDDG